MVIKRGFLWTFLVMVFFGLFLLPVEAADVFGYAWSENVGWIKFQGPNYGVEINETTGAMFGYAWSENIGWVNFNGVRLDFGSNDVLGAAQVCGPLVNQLTCGGGLLSAAGGWEGVIKMAGANYGVKRVIKPTGCALEGWAWGSDVVGWVRFGGAGYSVETDACPFVTPPPGATTCDFSASPASLIRPRNQSVLQWACKNANSCLISGLGSVSPVSGSRTVIVDRTTSFTLSCIDIFGDSLSVTREIKVFRPTYCEIIPQGPGC